MTDAPDQTTNDQTAVEASAPDAAEPPKKKAPAKKAAAKKAPAKKAAAKKAPAKKAAAKKAAPPAEAVEGTEPSEAAAAAEAKPAKKAAKKPAKKTAAKAAAPVEAPTDESAGDTAADEAAGAPAVLFRAPDATTAPRRTRKKAAPAEKPAAEQADQGETDQEPKAETDTSEEETETPAARPARKRTQGKPAAAQQAERAQQPQQPVEDEQDEDDEDDEAEESEGAESDGTGAPRRRRRRGGRRRRKPSGSGAADDAASDGDADDSSDNRDSSKNGNRNGSGKSDSSDAEADEESDDNDSSDGERQGSSSSSRRRRRRRREGEGGGEDGSEPNTVTRVRKPRSPEDEITAVAGSTRLEAKKQRRREGREAGRRRAPIVSEAEFLARRESVERVMVIRQRPDLTQIGVLEDKVLVEHYVARESQTSLIGNVYLGRVQNVLPSMEAAFIDIGKGRNAVLYAGEVNWASLGWKEGTPRKIESVLSSGQTVLVQVSKDPIGHKGARLTSQISLAGRFLVYVPDGTTSGISRKLPDTERGRLKALLKEIVPESAGVIVRTAAEGAAEDELTRDVERLKARWADIEAKSRKGNAPQLLYGEPDLTLKVVRDLFTEDFTKLVIQGEDAWATVHEYVENVAPDLAGRIEKYDPSAKDLFAAYRVDEQIAKGLDRKVWLPSGGSLVIDRTEAMTVIDVNTGKFTGSGGNLEETVTKNNLEAAEEIVRQLRLRDIGGIIVVDFIDMVLESNRDLVLRRLVECLGRDRTRHQVAEVTSLGLVQMTRKRIGTGLLEAFSENCSHCQGRGVIVHEAPVDPKRGGGGGESAGDGERRGNRRRRGRGNGEQAETETPKSVPSPAAVAVMAMAHPPVATDEEGEEQDVDSPVDSPVAVDPSDVAEEPTEAPEVVADLSEPAEPVVAAEPVEEPEPAPVAPVQPTKPVVVTRERRGVSRAVQTTTSTAPEPIVVAAPEPVAVPEQVAEPAKPVVVTTTRRRAATRPAGPPTDGADGADSNGVEADGEHPDESTALHVPVKKKGARKR